MQRITKKQVYRVIELLNNALDTPQDVYELNEDGSIKRTEDGGPIENPRTISLYGDICGWRLETRAGSRDLTTMGTLRETYHKAQAMLEGIKMAREV
jgi:hypothetical protein